ncbi:hypothetical protein V8E53_001726 [Lactarius tabidus]
MPTALPSDAAERHHLDPNVTSAYNVCREFERLATEKHNVRDIMHARILGYLIIYSPSITAQHEVVKVIHFCCNDHAILSALGSTFLDCYIRPFKKYKGRTPKGSSHPSRPSFDKTKDEMLAAIKEAPKNHPAAKEQALIRDGYRCVVSGIYDSIADSEDSEEKLSITKAEIKAAGGKVFTECALTVPDSTYFNVTGSSDKKDYSASVLAVLKRFGYDVERMNGEKVHSLYNVMTMQKDAHDIFDRLELWFEETATPNCYKVRKPELFLPSKGEVTFPTPDPVKLPLPSPRLLATHAACAQVAHLSGAGEYVDRILEDMEEICVLAHDGTSSEVLHHALMTLGPQAISV